MGVVYTMYSLGVLTGVQLLRMAEKRVLYCFSDLRSKKRKVFAQNHELKSQGRQRAGHILQYRVAAALLRIVCIELFGTSVHRFIIRCRQKINYRDRARRSWPT